jgi:hypothetical protein
MRATPTASGEEQGRPGQLDISIVLPVGPPLNNVVTPSH